MSTFVESLIVKPTLWVVDKTVEVTRTAFEVGNFITSDASRLRHTAQVAIGTIGACAQAWPGSTAHLTLLNAELGGLRDLISATRFFPDMKDLLAGKCFEHDIQLDERGAKIPNVIGFASKLGYLVVDGCSTLAFASKLALVNLGTLASKVADLPYMQFVRTATLDGARKTFAIVATILDVADIAREAVHNGGKITKAMWFRVASNITRLMAIVLFAQVGAYVTLAAHVAYATSSALTLTKDLLVHYKYLDSGKKKPVHIN